MSIRKTDKQFCYQLQDVDGDTYVPLSPYKSAKAKVTLYCNDCGGVFKTTPDKLLNRKIMCPKCALIFRGIKRNMTTDEFKQQVYKLVGNEYKVLGEYKKAKSKILMKHIKCGTEFEVTPDKFKHGTRCPKCMKEKKFKALTMTIDEFKQRVYKIYGDEYRILGSYVNGHTPIKVKHLVCGKTYTVIPSDLLRNHYCRYCIGNVRSNTKEFKQKVKNLVGDEYTVLGKYTNSITPILMKHNRCKYEFKITPAKFLSGRRCSACKETIGEALVRQVLTANNIKYIYGYQISNLVDKGKLHLDFWIPEYRVAIEYDGLQHYKPIEYFGGENQFKRQHKHDLMKDKYCKDNGIDLIRIPYTYTTKEQVRQILSIKLKIK